MIAKYYGKLYSREYLREKCYITRQGVSVLGINEAAESIGMSTVAVAVDFKTLQEDVPLPCIAHWRERHFIVIYKIKRDKVYVADPLFGLVTYSSQQFINGWIAGKRKLVEEKGGLILLEPTPAFYEREEDQHGEEKSWLRFLYSYLRPYKSYVGQLLLGLLISSVIQLMFPFLTQSLVDRGIRNQNLNFIYLILIAQLTLFFSQSAVEIIRGWLLLHLGSRINILIVSDFLTKMLRLPISFFDAKTTGDILQRLNDSERIEQFLSSSTLNILFSLFNLLIFGLVLAYYHIVIFVTFLIGACLYMSWVLLFQRKRAVLDFIRFDQSAGASSSVLTLVNGIQEIKLNNSQKRRRGEWEANQIKLFKTSVKGLALAQYQARGGAIINELKNILITFLAAKSVADGQISLGMMLAIQYIIGQLNVPINNFISFVRSGQDAKISIERLKEIQNIEEERGAEDNLFTAVPESRSIHIKDLSFQYGGPSFPYVLQNLNLLIPEGKVTALVGTSGSGKTTLLKLLLKFYEPQKGEINVSGTKLSNIDTTLWRSRCGVVMQDGYIFGDTILRNITESDAEGYVDKEKLIEAVRIANIENMIESFPAGYNTRIGSSGIQLSGGQRQRILIARAIYKNPDYLFFDEATSALDANNEKTIMENLSNFFQNKTVIIIAHRLSTVKNADQIIVMENGRITEIGTHEELTLHRKAYYTLVKNQLELGN
jgi:ATP-binding cassette subfamily B protein